jgi:ParB-like nuclease family protein
MKQHIDIKDLALGRDLDEGDNLDDLVKHIQTHGLKVPILITPQFYVIDGIRRIRALEALGEQFVEAEMVADFSHLVKGLDDSRTFGNGWRKPSARRLWHIHLDSKELIQQRIIASRESLRGKPRHSKLDNPLGPSRELLARALGFNSQSYYSAATNVYNIANDPGDPRHELANQFVIEVDAGRMTIYSARDRLEKARRFTGEAHSVSEQRAMLVNLVTSLSGVIKSTDKMGPINPHMKKEELQGYLSDLKNLRSKLYQFVRTFEEEIGK